MNKYARARRPDRAVIFPDRRESVHGDCGKNLRRDAILHRCKPGFAIPGEPARRMRRALFFTLRKNACPTRPPSSFSIVPEKLKLTIST
jgi:hypothetical protein